MLLKKISLINYRNFKSIDIDLSNKLNIFIGDNAQGKTNILESIYVLSLSKSFNTNNDKNLIMFGQNEARIKGNLVVNNKSKRLSIAINSTCKKMSINNKIIKKVSDYVLNLKVITFGPSDLELIKNTPSGRRKYLNIAISQLDDKYFNFINGFNYVLKTRNEYLKQIRDKVVKIDNCYLDILNDKYVDFCIKIYVKRRNYIDMINDRISNIYKDITGCEGFIVKYSSLFDNMDSNNYRECLFNKLNSNLDKEISYGNSVYGVHRDDFSFYLNDINLLEYGSQGQQRAAILSLKLAELDIFREYLYDEPILLLDDLFSELDMSKQNNIIKKLDKNVQTIITTTDLNKIENSLLKDAKIYMIKEGEVLDNYGK